MRLVWLGLLLLPLVAELANAQKCAGNPDAPENARIRCFSKRQTCRATCDTGYIFEGKNAKSAVYTCEAGVWTMKNGHEDRCSPVCKPPCKNGGYCGAPNQCTCHAGYEGAACERPVCIPECMNDGYCTAPNYCTCPHGFTGYYCEQAHPRCDMECLNGGQCAGINTCACPLEWTGRNCEIPVCDPACVNGDCIEPDVCLCEVGFAGAVCDEEEYNADYATSDPLDDYYGEDQDDYEEDEENTEDEEEEEVDVVEAAPEDTEDYEPEAEPEDEPEDEPEAEVEPEAEPEAEPEDETEDETEDEPEAEPSAEPEADPEDEDEDEEQGGADDTVDEDENGEDHTDDAETNGGDDEEDEDGDDPHVGASTSGNGVLEVVPQVLVGSAALLMARGW